MKKGSKERRVGCTVLACAIIVIIWQGAGVVANLMVDDFSLKAEDLKNFELKVPGWRLEQLNVAPTYMEVNLLKYRLTENEHLSRAEHTERAQGSGKADAVNSGSFESISGSAPQQVLVRLVHGYNMKDCMRIKGYEVAELTTENSETQRSSLISSGLKAGTPGGNSPNVQLWQLTSPAGDKSLWLSDMLRAGDFEETGKSTTDMAFPRVGIPTDPNWVPSGLTLKSFRHPVRNFKFFMRAKWNGARCDLLTFLGLRKPAWASDDALTFLVIWTPPPGQEADEEAVRPVLADIHNTVLKQLQEWRAAETGESLKPGT